MIRQIKKKRQIEKDKYKKDKRTVMEIDARSAIKIVLLKRFYLLNKRKKITQKNYNTDKKEKIKDTRTVINGD